MEESAAKTPKKKTTISAIQLLTEANKKKEEQQVKYIEGLRQKLTQAKEEEIAYRNLLSQQAETQENSIAYGNLINFYKSELGQTNQELVALKQQVFHSTAQPPPLPQQYWQAPPSPITPPPTNLASPTEVPLTPLTVQSKKLQWYYLAAASCLGILIAIVFNFVINKSNSPVLQRTNYPIRIIDK
ncbi:hypothetical protein FD723_40620 (plasmid) [Nostoc sp. C052]|uniref:hypothetical protein n=1 Tax=Nostoc sp. C052 TaxID=2576902 RepID=UPI0015C33148|nr:hypothetical protein [Nostoc sp. C052]QLE46519.1 hypothetical protein FD723_40620 [Nostoc sp. C052]